MPRVPDRWEIYSKFGKIIKGTRFLACKTPLKSNLTASLADDMRFTPNDLIEEVPQIGLVVDFTNTDRYYNSNDLKRDEGIDYKKIYTIGRVIPGKKVISQFYNTVDAFLRDTSKENKIIVAHCTHGINRTGYFICRYMITKLNFPPKVAIEEFGKARGHMIERENYIADLLRLHPRKFDFSLSDSKSKDPSQLSLPHSKKKKQKSKTQKDGNNFSNNALHSQDVPNYYHQTAPYQQKLNPQLLYQRPYQQRPYQNMSYQQRPYQQRSYQNMSYKHRPYQQNRYQYEQASHEWQPFNPSKQRSRYGMYSFDEQRPSQQGYQGHKKHNYRRVPHRSRGQEKDYY